MKHLLILFAFAVLLGCLTACQQSKGKQQVEAYPVNSLESELEQLYRLDLLPQYRPGIVEQISSYDTTGNNDDGFSGKYSFLRKEGNKLVLADLKGPGVINRIWTPTPTPDTIQFYLDGEATPRISIPFIDLFSGKIFPFVNPVCGNEVGGYYCYIPIQYGKSCRIMYKGSKIQFHQIQYRSYSENTHVESFPVNWSEKAKLALEKACNSWNMQTDPLSYMKKSGTESVEVSKQFFLLPGETVSFFDDTNGGRIVGIEVECGAALEGKNKDILLQAQWDNDSELAINAPAADFFGYAFGKPAMKSIFAGSISGANYCYIPMPYREKASLKLTYQKRENVSQPRVEIRTKVHFQSAAQNPEIEGRLYTAWRRENKPKDGEPYLFAKLQDRGHYIGTIQQAQGLNPGMTLFFESDDSTIVDGKMRMHGTGSEDYYNGGWYALLDRWDRGVSLPIHGSLDYSLPMSRTGGYRFYTTDKMSFEKDLQLTIEHGPEHNLLPVDYTSIIFYYGSRPTSDVSQPNPQLSTVYYPETYVFCPQLMELSLGWDTRIENKGRIEMTTGGEGMARIMLNEVPEGKYKMSLSYYQTPDGGEFSIWNRQKMIADWKDASASKETFMEKQEIGIINITRQTNSISIRLKKTDKGGKFQFENLYLERVKN